MPPRARLLKFQLALLELYEGLLESPAWDEAKVNTTLKTFLSSVLALIRVQQSDRRTGADDSAGDDPPVPRAAGGVARGTG